MNIYWSLFKCKDTSDSHNEKLFITDVKTSKLLALPTEVQLVHILMLLATLQYEEWCIIALVSSYGASTVLMTHVL